MPVLPQTLSLPAATGAILRDWRPIDAPALEPVCGDWDICTFSSVPWTYSTTAAAEWIDHWQPLRAAGQALGLAVLAPGAALPGGHVNLVRFHDDDRAAALGYWLAPAARGRGLATQATRQLCDWAFAHLRLTRIELAILPDNHASHGVARRLGAVREGVRADSHAAGGRRWDMVIYGLSPR